MGKERLRGDCDSIAPKRNEREESRPGLIQYRCNFTEPMVARR